VESDATVREELFPGLSAKRPTSALIRHNQVEPRHGPVSRPATIQSNLKEALIEELASCTAGF